MSTTTPAVDLTDVEAALTAAQKAQKDLAASGSHPTTQADLTSVVNDLMAFIHRYKPQPVNPTPTPPTPTPVIKITSANTTSFTTGTSSSFTVTATGTPTPALSKTGTLPTGVTFTDNGNGTATLSGTPTGATGNYPITISASNGVLTTVTQPFILVVTVVQIAPKITSASNTTFTLNSSNTFTVTTTGTPTPTFSYNGTLPAGVTFVDNANGTATISGTPTGSATTYAITITVSNNVSPNATQAFSLITHSNTVAPTITSGTNTSFTVGIAGTFTITSTGTPTATLSKSGSLPSGVTFTNNGNGTATLAGTPASGSTGSYTLTITASNGTLPNATQSFTLTVGAGVTTRLALQTSGGITRLLQENEPFVFKGITVYALPDHVTNNGGTGGLTGTGFGSVQYQNINSICSTISGWGANVIRVRTLASDAVQGVTGPTGLSLTQYVNACVAIRNAAVANGLYVMFTDWDPIDGPYAGSAWAGQANRSNGPFSLFTALLTAMPNDPYVIYDPFAAPNNITQTQWYTAFQQTWNLFRTNGYRGILVADPNSSANSGPGGAGWVDNSTNGLTALENYDISLLGGSQHQTAFSKHDYANEYNGSVTYGSTNLGGGTGTLTTSVPYTKPSGITAGDVIVIIHASTGEAAVPTANPPSGFTAAPGSWPVTGGPDSNTQYFSVWVWYKIATSSEPSSYTVSTSSAYSTGTISYASGNDQTNPIQSALAQYGTGTTTTFPSVTTAINNELILIQNNDNGNTHNAYVAPTGTTPTFITEYSGAGNPPQYMAQGVLATAGTIGVRTMTNNGSATNGWTAVTVAIQPTSWNDATWLAAVGGGTGEHAVFETEIGNYNGSGSINYIWDSEALSDLVNKNSTMPNYIGTVPFLFGNWSNANAMTSGVYTSNTEWGTIVEESFGGTPTPPPESLLPTPSALNSLSYTWQLLGHDEFEGIAGQTADQFLSTEISGTQLGWSLGDFWMTTTSTLSPSMQQTAPNGSYTQCYSQTSVISAGTGNGILLRRQSATGGPYETNTSPGSSIPSTPGGAINLNGTIYNYLTGGISSAGVWSINPRGLASTYPVTFKPISGAPQPEMVIEFAWQASERNSTDYPIICSYNESDWAGAAHNWASEVDWCESSQESLNLHYPSGTLSNGTSTYNGSSWTNSPGNLNVFTYHIRTNNSSDSAVTTYLNGNPVTVNGATASDWWKIWSYPMFIFFTNWGNNDGTLPNGPSDARLVYVRIWSAASA